MMIQETITQLESFRQKLYESFFRRADALMDLLDALSSNRGARSVVELSLNPLFRHGHSSVYDGIDNFFQATSVESAPSERRFQEQRIMRLIATQLQVPQQRNFWLLGVDVTSVPRPLAHTLQDRTFVYQANAIFGNKPITIGHHYSALVAFPEKEGERVPSWVVPLSMRRVASQETKTVVGAEQISALLTDEMLPFHKDLSVQVVDSTYSALTFLGWVVRHDNLVTIARLRGNRTLCRTPSMEFSRKRGHPIWYGEPFDLKEPKTWGEPKEVFQTFHTTRRGCIHTVLIEVWHNLLMRGRRNLPMHQHPFNLIRIRVVDANGRSVFHNPLWLIALGPRRHEISSLDAWKSYNQRYDVEHFFRFGKQRLLLAAYQTPEVEHEENWWQIVQLAYIQLWLARSLASAIPRPWERCLPRSRMGIESPTAVQRDLGRIIRSIGTPASLLKPRGKSPGRLKGMKPGKRKRHPVIKKGPKARKRAYMST